MADLRVLGIAAACIGLFAGLACRGGGVADDVQTQPTATSTAQLLSAELEQLVALLNRWNESPAKITYDYRDQLGQTSTLIFYWRPPSEYRSELTDGQRTLTFFSFKDEAFLCSASGQVCYVHPGASTIPPPFASLAGVVSLVDYLGDADVEASVSNATIAGRKATCFGLGSAMSERDNAEMCFGDEGLLLRLTSDEDFPPRGERLEVLEARDVSREVSDSDFVLPFPTAIADLSP